VGQVVNRPSGRSSDKSGVPVGDYRRFLNRTALG